MKLRNLILAVMAGAALLTGCEKEVDLGPAKLVVNPTEVAFEKADIASQDIVLTATRDWAVTGLPDWIALSSETGPANAADQTLTLSVTENKGNNRSATLTFSIGFERATLSVSQPGPEGEVDNGDGSKKNPFNVTGVLEYLEELGADVTSPKNVYVAGKISGISEAFTTQYGNGSFTISDDGEATSPQFTAYRVMYLGNAKFASGDTQIEVGDDVILYGKVVNYKGNTPETAQKEAFLYSLNGVNKGGDEGGEEEGGEEGPDETLEPASASNIAGLVAKIAKDSSNDNKSAYDGITLSGATVTYVNGGSVYLEDKSGAVLLYMKDSGLKAGDVITGAVSGEGYYYNGLPEIISLGSAYTKTEGTVPAPTEMTIERLLSTYTSQLSRYLIIKNVTVTTGMDSRKAVISQGDKSINVYAAIKEGLKLDKDATGDIIVFPTLYNTTKQVSFWDNSHFTGNSGGDTPGGDTPGGDTSDIKKVSIADFLAAPVSTEQWYELTGKVSNIVMDKNDPTKVNPYGNFDLTDDAGTKVYVYGLTATKVDKNDKSFESLGIKEGDTITIITLRAEYNGTPQAGGTPPAYIKPNGDTPGGDTPGGEVSGLDSNVSFTAGTNAYTDNTVNVTYGDKTYDNVANLKLGKGSAFGDGTFTLPAGTVEVSFFAVGWKGADASLKFTIGSTEKTFNIVGNDGASGSGPYAITVANSDKYKISLGSALAAATEVKVETYEGTNKGYRAFIFAVQASETASGDEPGGGDQPGGDQPGGNEPNLPVNDGLTEATAFTVQDAIYVAKNGTEDKEYFVKAVVGKDISIKNGVISLELVDGTTDANLAVVKAKSFDGAAWDGTEPIDWMDKVVFKGKVKLYSTLPALLDAVLVKWNGKMTFLDYDFATIAAMNAAATSTATEYTLKLTDAVVAYAPSDKNAIIKDATGSVLLYKDGHGLKQGQKFTGKTTVTLTLYNGASELTAIDAAFTGDEAVVAPEAVTLAALVADFAKWQNAYVKVENVEVTAVNGKNINVKDGDATYIVYSNAGNATCAVGDKINAVGTVCKYKDDQEIKAWTLEDIVVVPATGGGDNPGTGGGDNPGTGGGDNPGTGGGDNPGTGGGETSGPVTFDFTAQGWANQTAFETMNSGDITLTADKGTGSNAPKYYTTGTAVRLYAGNTLTVASAGKNIAKVEFTFSSGEGTNAINPDSGTFADNAWTGSANSVTFTVDGTTGHRRVAKLVVTLAE